ncbi:hypothetical protein ACFO4O_01070 [Glaciecola siphonariae]|uniref:Uncharacterized protein n=1 Tax=Glaciecola siphonariae TaxID=521012 RepID=A0ABV9LQG4_9ALTE
MQWPNNKRLTMSDKMRVNMPVNMSKQRENKLASAFLCGWLGLMCVANPANAQVVDEPIEQRINPIEQQYLEAQGVKASAQAPDRLTSANQDMLGQQQADYEHILFEYFQQHYDVSLMLIEAGDQNHGFSALAQDDQDRLRLMQGASQLKLGLYQRAQRLLLALLSKTTSEYVQANTWYWLAKAGFENRQYHLSERAFEVIEQAQLAPFIRPEQFQELVYLTVFARMQQGQAWQSRFKRLNMSTIYPAYIHANNASLHFNAGDYAQAEASFIAAKQALLSYQRGQNSWLKQARGSLDSWFDFAWANPMTWFSADPNQQAQGKVQEQKLNSEQKEVDALFDRINLGLAYALLRQQDDDNALSVINTISKRGGESEQALLTLGWAMAQQNRWQNAIGVWQYLRQQSAGLYGLQASYGIAYAYQQQGDFNQAFFALDDTSEQIQNTLSDLDRFSARIVDTEFFDALGASLSDSDTEQLNVTNTDDSLKNKEIRRVNSIAELASALGLEDSDNVTDTSNAVSPASMPAPIWPENLLDIKRVFLSARSDFDAAFLLSVREEARQSLLNLQAKAKQLRTLEQMLSIRQQRYTQRQQDLSLESAALAIEQAKAQIAQVEQKLSGYRNLNEKASQYSAQYSVQDSGQYSREYSGDNALNLQMMQDLASKEQSRHLRRLLNAQGRISRLQQAGELKEGDLARFARLQGILNWQFANNSVTQLWAHGEHLAEAKNALSVAEQAYQRLVSRQQDTQVFARQKRQINALALNIIKQQSAARAIYTEANSQLQQNLLSIINQRIEQLKTQQVNTRLAKIRLQDLTPEAL